VKVGMDWAVCRRMAMTIRSIQYRRSTTIFQCLSYVLMMKCFRFWEGPSVMNDANRPNKEGRSHDAQWLTKSNQHSNFTNSEKDLVTPSWTSSRF
jgi:hypothetical protein